MPESIEPAKKSEKKTAECVVCGHQIITETITKEVEVLMVGGPNQRQLNTIVVGRYCSHCKIMYHQ